MRRLWPVALAAILIVVAGACSADEPAPAEPTAPAGELPARPEIGSWTPLPDLPQVRTELSAAALDGMVYVAGGFTQGPGGELFFRYDVAAETWTELAPLPDHRHHAPLAAYDGKVYVVGGYSHEAHEVSMLGPANDTLFIYDIAEDSWRQGPPLPYEVGAHAVATTSDGMIHMVGGVAVESDRIRPRHDHVVFDTSTETWSRLPDLPTAREHLGAAYLDGKVYVAAGRFGGEGVAFEAFDVESQEWEMLPPVPTSRSGVAVVAFDGQIYVLGGETLNGTFDEVERYDPATETWEEVAPMPTARHGLGGVALDDGVMIIAGGPTVSLSYSTDVEIWRP